MLSQVKESGKVSFPEFMGHKIYMLPFYKGQVLTGKASYWQKTVDQMLDGVDTDSRMYLMVDQGVVEANKTHRRGGVHIDGNWVEELSCHGGGGHSTPSRSGHRHGGHITGAWSGNMREEALLLASDVKACVAYDGEWFGEVGVGGDCSHIDLSGLNKIELESNRAYVGNVSMLHESIPVPVDCLRTLVRINIPDYSFK